MGLDQLSHLLQHAVAGAVAVGVVDLFEVIEVEQDRAHRRREIALLQGQMPLHHILHVEAGEELGERVADGALVGTLALQVDRPVDHLALERDLQRLGHLCDQLRAAGGDQRAPVEAEHGHGLDLLATLRRERHRDQRAAIRPGMEAEILGKQLMRDQGAVLGMGAPPIGQGLADVLASLRERWGDDANETRGGLQREDVALRECRVVVDMSHREGSLHHLEQPRGDIAKVAVEQHGLGDIAQRAIELREPLDIGIALAEQIETAIEVAQLVDHEADQMRRDDRPMLACNQLHRVALDLAQGVVEDVAARHVVLVEGTHRIEVGFVLRHELRSVGKTAEQVAGEEHPGLPIEAAEGAWKVGIGREDELERAVLELEAPIVLIHQPEWELQSVMLEQRFGPPMRDHGGIGAGVELVDQRQRGGNVRVLMMADVPADLVERDHLLDLAQRVSEGQPRARVE